jgi:dihydrofolate reductase
MRKLVLAMSLSLDGFAGDVDGKGEWMFRTQGETGRAFVAEKMSGAGLHIAGKYSFEQWATWWPQQTMPIATAMNTTPKAVFARNGVTRPGGTGVWAEAEVISDDLATGIERLKKQDGKFILAQGGIAFGQSLVASGLVDEYWLVVHPTVLGKGLPLFNKLAQPLPLKVIETKSFPSGASWTAYQPA